MRAGSRTILRLAQILAACIAIEPAIDAARHRIDILPARPVCSAARSEFERHIEDALIPKFELLAAVRVRSANDIHRV